LAEMLDQAQLWGTRPVEAGDVLGIDADRGVLVARDEAVLVEGRQTPALSGEHVESVVGHEAAIEDPHAQRIAVALPRIGGDAGTEEVRLHVGLRLHAIEFLSLSEQREAALARALTELGNMA